MSRTDTWIEHAAQQMLSWLHPGHLADEEQARILAGLFRAVAKASLPNYNRTIAIPDLRSFDRIPGRFLPLLGRLVGLDATAGFPQYFTESNWRRFGADAMTIWRSVGIDYRSMLVALVARPVLISDWHVRKDIIDVSLLPWFGLSAPGASPWAEHTVDMHVPDPFGVFEDLGGTLASNEKAVNQSMIRAALGPLRPWNQRLDVSWYAFVEDFSLGMFQWSRVTGSAATLDEDAQTLTIGASTELQISVGRAATLWQAELTWEILTTFEPGTYDFRLRADTDAEDSVLVRVVVVGDAPAAATVSLHTESGGVVSAAITSGSVVIAEGVETHIQINSTDGLGGGTDDISVYVDGNLTFLDVVADTFSGTCTIASSASSAQAVQYTEVAVHPVTVHRVGPNP